MSGLIKIDATELDRLSRDTKAQMGRVQDIRQAIDSAVQNKTWQSRAALNFTEGWMQDAQLLKQLEEHLQQWSEHCRKQVAPAERVNQPFRR